MPVYVLKKNYNINALIKFNPKNNLINVNQSTATHVLATTLVKIIFIIVLNVANK
jgi:hypothetical protein